MKELLNRFETKAPEIVFEWHDDQPPAKGWVVIDSLRGGVAGGGTRMREGLDRREVAFLMQGEAELSDEAIFGDVSTTIAGALQRCHDRSQGRRGIATAPPSRSRSTNYCETGDEHG